MANFAIHAANNTAGQAIASGLDNTSLCCFTSFQVTSAVVNTSRAQNGIVNGFQRNAAAQWPSKRAKVLRVMPVVGAGSPVRPSRMLGGI